MLGHAPFINAEGAFALMPRLSISTLVSLLLCMLLVPSLSSSTHASPTVRLFQDQESGSTRARIVRRRRHRRRVGGDQPRRHRGIGGSFKEAGLSAGRGGKRLGQNMADGRPVRGGKEFGKGMSGFGKHVGKGTGKIGKRVGHVTRRAFTP